MKQFNIIESVTHFGKLTGRIYLENITQILETCPDNFDCICDYKDQGYILKNTLAKKRDLLLFVIPDLLHLAGNSIVSTLSLYT